MLNLVVRKETARLLKVKNVRNFTNISPFLSVTWYMKKWSYLHPNLIAVGFIFILFKGTVREAKFIKWLVSNLTKIMTS